MAKVWTIKSLTTGDWLRYPNGLPFVFNSRKDAEATAKFVKEPHEIVLVRD